ncbi:hypothetical protein OSTOST_17211 [Ostertagia ostertagi]
MMYPGKVSLDLYIQQMSRQSQRDGAAITLVYPNIRPPSRLVTDFLRLENQYGQLRNLTRLPWNHYFKYYRDCAKLSSNIHTSTGALLTSLKI